MAAGRAERERERCRRRHFVCEGPGWARSRPRPRGGSRGGPAGALSRERSVRPLVGPNGGRCRGATGRVSLSVSGPELTELSRWGGGARPGALRLYLCYWAGAGAVFRSKLALNAKARGVPGAIPAGSSGSQLTWPPRRGAPRLKNKSVRLLPGPGGTSRAVTNASDPGLAGSDAPPGLAKHLLRCLPRAKSKPSSLKTKNGFFWGEGLSWRSLPTAPQWSSCCQPRCCLDNTSSSPGICGAGFRFKTGRFGSLPL
uniref:uncharacterized protein LOC129130870 isoform X1 n=1 Tax=Agelaius phoeniceus TaxID=39638 RepID=UPI0023ECDD31|nr:uncharacterized protein LOC129130870 isoform X1 [Agelaius phoeniceus]